MPIKKFRRLGAGASTNAEVHHFMHHVGNVLQWLVLRGEMRDTHRAERKARPIRGGRRP